MSRNSRNHAMNAESELLRRQRQSTAFTLAASRQQQQQQQLRKRRKRKKDKQSVSPSLSSSCSTCDGRFDPNDFKSNSQRSTCVQCTFIRSSSTLYQNKFSYIDIVNGTNVTYSTAATTTVTDKKQENTEKVRLLPKKWSSATANDRDFGANCAGVIENREKRVCSEYNKNRIANRRFAIYENLCAFCGFAIGTGSFHTNCNVNALNFETNSIAPKNHNFSEENIYENICNTCHFIYDGDTCTHCEIISPSKHKAKSVNELTKQLETTKTVGKPFSGIFDSLRQKFKVKATETVSKKPKIEIVHNFDEVFKTNKTFDLNEIVQLKTEQEKNIYGKLKQTNSQQHSFNSESTSAPYRENISTSESNFFNSQKRNFEEIFDSSFLNCDSFVSDTILYCNSFAPPSYEDAVNNSMYKNIATTAHSTPASSFYQHSSSISSSNSTLLSSKVPSVECLLACDDSLRNWMSTIRRQTHEYSDANYSPFECSTVKCMPSKAATIDDIFRNYSPSTRLPETNSEELALRVSTFKSGFTERIKSKRNAVYFKDPLIVDPCSSEFLVNDDCDDDNDEKFVNVNISDIDTELLQKPQTLVTVNNTETNEIAELSTIHQYLQRVKTFYIAQIALSSSLNNLVLVCGDKNIHLLTNFLLSNSNSTFSTQQRQTFASVLVKPFTNITNFLITVQKMSVKKQLSACTNMGQGSLHSLNAFNYSDNACDDSSQKEESIQQRSRSTDNVSHSSPTEFECDESLRKSNYSSPFETSTENRFERKQNMDENDCIYQPIWMFNTVGVAESETSDVNDDFCGSVIDESIIDDCSEWEEVTEAEFLFSTDRFDSISTISHETNDHSIVDSVSTKPREIPDGNDDGYTAFVRNRAQRTYQKVCILYGEENTKFNKIIYDYNGNNSIEPNAYINESETSLNKISKNDLTGSRETVQVGNIHINNSNSNSNINTSQTVANHGSFEPHHTFDSIIEWKNMIRNVSYIEDEEDLVSYATNNINIINFLSLAIDKQHETFTVCRSCLV